MEVIKSLDFLAKEGGVADQSIICLEVRRIGRHVLSKQPAI